MRSVTPHEPWAYVPWSNGLNPSVSITLGLRMYPQRPLSRKRPEFSHMGLSVANDEINAR